MPDRGRCPYLIGSDFGGLRVISAENYQNIRLILLIRKTLMDSDNSNTFKPEKPALSVV